MAHAGRRPPAYRSARCSTTWVPPRRRSRSGLIEGSDPSGGGPTAGCPAISAGEGGILNGIGIVRSSSIWPPFTDPENVLFPALNDTLVPSILPSWIAIGASVPPKNPPPVPSTVPVRLLPSCRNVKTIVPPPVTNAEQIRASLAAGTGLQSPVIPAPVGISRSHTATCGRSSTDFAEIVAVAVTSPGEVTSTVTAPDAFRYLHSPHTVARERLPRRSFIRFLVGRIAIADSDRFPAPVTLNVTSLSVIGTTRPCPS